MDIWIFTEFPRMPLHHLACNQTSNYNHHHQHDTAGTDAAGSLSLAVCLLVLNQLDNAPNNQQHRPIVRKPEAKVVPGNNPHVAEKEENSDDDQHNWASERTLVAWRSCRRSRRRS